MRPLSGSDGEGGKSPPEPTNEFSVYEWVTKWENEFDVNMNYDDKIWKSGTYTIKPKVNVGSRAGNAGYCYRL